MLRIAILNQNIRNLTEKMKDFYLRKFTSGFTQGELIHE